MSITMTYPKINFVLVVEFVFFKTIPFTRKVGIFMTWKIINSFCPKMQYLMRPSFHIRTIRTHHHFKIFHIPIILGTNIWVHQHKLPKPRGVPPCPARLKNHSSTPVVHEDSSSPCGLAPVTRPPDAISSLPSTTQIHSSIPAANEDSNSPSG